MKFHFAALILLVFSFSSTTWAQDLDLASFMSPQQRKNAEKQSGILNEAIKGANEATGSNITPLEDQEGVMRLFFTATPSPSPSPTPSVTPSSSVTPTPSTTPSPSVTPTTTPTPSNTMAPTPSKSPSPTPFADGSSRIINGQQVIVAEEIETTIATIATDEDDEDAEVEVDVKSDQVAEGDDVQVEEIEAGGDFGDDGSATTARFVSDEYLLPGLSRQFSIGARFCGIRVYIGSGFFGITPTSCSISVYKAPVISGTVAFKPGRGLVARFKVVAFYCRAEIRCNTGLRVRISVLKPVKREITPTLPPSGAPEPDN